MKLVQLADWTQISIQVSSPCCTGAFAETSHFLCWLPSFLSCRFKAAVNTEDTMVASKSHQNVELCPLKCLWLAFAGAGVQLEQAIDGKSEFGSLSQEAIFSQACKQDSLVWFVDIVLCAGVLFLLGWSLHYTVPAVVSICMYRQLRNLLCLVKRKPSQAQAIMLTTVSYFIFRQAISVAWSTAASTTLNLNYPLYQGTACLPLAIASWIYQQKAVITCLNTLVCNTGYLNCNKTYADCLVARPKHRGELARGFRPCSGAFAQHDFPNVASAYFMNALCYCQVSALRIDSAFCQMS